MGMRECGGNGNVVYINCGDSCLAYICVMPPAELEMKEAGLALRLFSR